MNDGESMLVQEVMHSQDPGMEVDSGEDMPDFRHHLLPRNNSGGSLVDAIAIDSAEVTGPDPKHVDKINEPKYDRSKRGMKSGECEATCKECAHSDVTGTPATCSIAHAPIVVPSTQEGFETLGDALNNAPDGARLHLSPGVYVVHTPIDVSAHNISLCAASSDSDTLVEIQLQGPGASFIVSGRNLRFCGINFVQHGYTWREDGELHKKGMLPASINVIEGDAHFVRCTFTSSVLHGICVWNSASPCFKDCNFDRCAGVAVLCRSTCNPTFEGNTFCKNQSFAIVMMDAASGAFVSNRITRNKKCAIICSGSTKTRFERNVISDGLQGAFWVQGSSRCCIVDNKIENNLKAGVQVSHRADPIVTGNVIRTGEGGGIMVHDDARGNFANNVLETSMRAGIGVADCASPVFAGNAISNNEGGGAVLTGRCSPVFASNTFTGNGFVGIGIRETASALLDGNIISWNKGYGLLLQATCSVHLQDCTLRGNRRAAICVCEQASLTMSRCVLDPGEVPEASDEQVAGLLVYDYGTAVIADCDFRHHKMMNILMQDDSEATLTSNQMTGSCVGLKMHGSCRATLRENSFSEYHTAVLLSDKTEAVASRNVFTDGRGSGVKASGAARCILLHNLIMVSNGPLVRGASIPASAERILTTFRSGHRGSGVHVEINSNGLLDMHANRVSANAEYGVSVVGGTSRLKANVIYANEKGGLCLRDTREASLLANCVARGGGEPLSVQGARKKRILKDLADSSTGNLFEGPGTRPADFREVVMHSLWVLEDWGRLRAGRIVIETLGEISHVAFL